MDTYSQECTIFSLYLSSGLSTVEAFNYKTNEWIYVAHMNTRRSSVGVGVVDGKTQVCVTWFILCVLQCPYLKGSQFKWYLF